MSLSLSLTVQHYYAKNKNPLLKFTIQACRARQFLLAGLQNLNRKKRKIPPEATKIVSKVHP